MNNIVMEIIF